MKLGVEREICRACRKRIYHSKRDARRASSTMHKRIRIYPCPAGNGLHVAKEQR